MEVCVKGKKKRGENMLWKGILKYFEGGNEFKPLCP